MDKKELLGALNLVVDTIDRVSANDGVIVSLVHPDIQPSRVLVIDIKLSYKGYNTTDRFNTNMTFNASDAEDIAVKLLSSFFYDYFRAKVG